MASEGGTRDSCGRIFYYDVQKPYTSVIHTEGRTLMEMEQDYIRSEYAGKPYEMGFRECPSEDCETVVMSRTKPTKHLNGHKQSEQRKDLEEQSGGGPGAG